MTMVAEDESRTDETEFDFEDAPDGASPEETRLIAAAERIRLQYKGIRVTLGGMPQSRKVSPAQKARMAEEFGADTKMLSASSLLWDAKEEAVKAVRSATGAIGDVFRDRTTTLPTTIPGLRKIKKDCVGEVHRKLLQLQENLGRACETLKLNLPRIIEELKDTKKELFNAEDYKDFDPVRDIKVKWSFPVVTEDQELAELDDAVYQHELQRVRQEGAQAIKQFEGQLAEGLVKMLDGVIEKLEGEDDKTGKRKVFMGSTVLKVFDEIDFFNSQLKQLGVGGEALTQAMDRIGKVVKGQTRDTLPDALRKGSEGYRQHVRDKFAKIAEGVASKAVPKLRRKLLRKKLTSQALKVAG